jgi:tetratricopeptide (TPR) repeat protein
VIHGTSARFANIPILKNRVPDAIFGLAFKRVDAKDPACAEPLLLYGIQLEGQMFGKAKGYYERMIDVAGFYREREQFDEMERYIRSIRDFVDPKDRSMGQVYAIAVGMEGASWLWDRGDANRAIEPLTEAHRLLGEWHRTTNQSDKSLAANFGFIGASLAKCHMDRGDLEDALQLFLEAVPLVPLNQHRAEFDQLYTNCLHRINLKQNERYADFVTNLTSTSDSGLAKYAEGVDASRNDLDKLLLVASHRASGDQAAAQDAYKTIQICPVPTKELPPTLRGLVEDTVRSMATAAKGKERKE